MQETIGNILEEGKKTGFSTVETFGEKVEKEEYDQFTDQKTRKHSSTTQRVTTRAFWDVGDPVGFNLSKPGAGQIKNAFSTIYSINLPTQTGNYAHLLPAAVDRVDVRIYDETFGEINAHHVDELAAQINETLISPPFKDLELRKLHFSKTLKRIYIGNSRGLTAKY
ncbi:MAG: hypothetical protein GY950_20130, partial [bacterium]|nr:hypothetical protein [bacterium]